MLPIVTLDPAVTLPADGYAGALAGRVRRPDVDAPSVVAIRADGMFDVSADFPTMRDLCETPDPTANLKAGRGERIGTLGDTLANTRRRRARRPGQSHAPLPGLRALALQGKVVPGPIGRIGDRSAFKAPGLPRRTSSRRSAHEMPAQPTCSIITAYPMG
jgi:hypothetical protein